MPPGTEPTVYITFDDGPHPVATHFALAELEKYEATATFFCIGKKCGRAIQTYISRLKNAGIR